MKRPIHYRGRKPIPISADTMAGILKTVARSGKQKDFIDGLGQMGETFNMQSRFANDKIKFDMRPKVVNYIKDFCYENKLHEGDDDHNRFVSDVIYSPPEGCPDYQERNG